MARNPIKRPEGNFGTITEPGIISSSRQVQRSTLTGQGHNMIGQAEIRLRGINTE